MDRKLERRLSMKGRSDKQQGTDERGMQVRFGRWRICAGISAVASTPV
jgi:hypothetical protein